MENNPKVKGPPFTKEIDKTIARLMKKWKGDRCIYAKISKEISSKEIKFSAKRIRQRWRSILDPSLNRESLDETEKFFIILWVNKELILHDKIRWVELVKEINTVFGKNFSENKVKNFWYLKGEKVELTPLDRLRIACNLTSIEKLCIACADAYKRDFE